MNLTPDEIGSIIHEANRQLRLVIGEPPGPHWRECDQQLRDSCVNGVRKARECTSPKEMHEEWLAFKASQGWTWGPIKDVQAKRHPAMLPYAELPEEQRVKDLLFLAMAEVLDGSDPTVFRPRMD